MNVASLELCRELYELSAWEGESHPLHGYEDEQGKHIPYYTLGYLLRKLVNVEVSVFGDPVFGMNQVRASDRSGHSSIASIPEDAAAKLAIELFKQGVLTRSES